MPINWVGGKGGHPIADPSVYTPMPSGYTSFTMPASNSGYDNKDQIRQFLTNQDNGVLTSGGTPYTTPIGTGQADDPIYGQTFYVPTDKYASMQQPYDQNPHKEGSLWTSIRDAAESVGSLVGNYFLPGSSLLTDQLVSKGSQEQLNSPLGKIAQLASGAGGSFAGNMSNYGSLWNSATGGSELSEFTPTAQMNPAGFDAVEGAGATTFPVTPPESLWSGGSSIGESVPSTFASPDLLGASQLPGSSLQTALSTIGAGGDTLAAGRSAAGSALTGDKAKPGYLQSVMDTLTNPKNLLPEVAAVGSLLSAGKTGGGSGSGGATQPLATVQQAQQQLANQLLSQYNGGTLNAADTYKIDQWEKHQIAETNQYYASAGIGNSDMHVKALGDVKSQAEAMRSQAQNQYLSQAISVLGGAGSTAGSLVTANVQQDTALQQAQQQFFSNLSRLSTVTDNQGAA